MAARSCLGINVPRMAFVRQRSHRIVRCGTVQASPWLSVFIPEHFPDFEQQEARFERALAAFPPADQERIRAAHTFAARAHEGQERFGPGHIPYLIHPLRVACSLVDEFREVDADAFIAALLHDVIEDCGVTIQEIEQRFGRQMSHAVAALTWRKGTDAKWQQAAAMRRQPRFVRLIKASDVIDNSRAMWQVDNRARVLRLLYGYGHWGRHIIESLGAPATIFLDHALRKSTTLHFENDPEPPLAPNEGKALIIEGQRAEGRGQSLRKLITRHSSLVTHYARYPIRTHVITPQDDPIDLARRYAVPYLRPGDLLAISERIIAITQGRAFRIEDVQPSAWAKFLVRFVHKSPYGIGLASPWTMELAIREAGLPRILLAAVVAAITKPFGIRGMFYRVVGKHINAIDGPCDYTLQIPFPPLGARGGEGELGVARNPSQPPLTVRGGAQSERYAKLGPKDPNRVAEQIAREIGVSTAIIDANDLGVEILGASEGVDREFVKQVFRDNPLGQSTEQTPMAIVRLFPDS